MQDFEYQQDGKIILKMLEEQMLKEQAMHPILVLNFFQQ